MYIAHWNGNAQLKNDFTYREIKETYTKISARLLYLRLTH